MNRALALAAGGLAALILGLRMPAAPPPALVAVGPGGLPAPHSLLDPLPAAIVSQAFGCTAFALEPAWPGCPGGHFHSGLDLAARAGTPVHTAAGGQVVTAGWNAAGYGLCVLVDHGHGLTTLYAHLLETAVAAGVSVTAGEVLGRVGSTGNSTGAHLHFEVRSLGRPTDPEPLLAAIPKRGGTQ